MLANSLPICSIGCGRDVVIWKWSAFSNAMKYNWWAGIVRLIWLKVETFILPNWNVELNSHINHTHSLARLYPTICLVLCFHFPLFTFVSFYIDFDLNNMLFENTPKTLTKTTKYPFAQIHTINWMHKFSSMQNFLSSQQTECWPRIIKQLSHQYVALPENIY